MKQVATCFFVFLLLGLVGCSKPQTEIIVEPPQAVLPEINVEKSTEIDAHKEVRELRLGDDERVIIYNGREVIVTTDQVSGRIFDEKDQLIKNVLITLRSLDTEAPFSSTFLAEDLAEDGTYLIDPVPAGILVEITASKQSYTTRKRIEVFKSNKSSPCLNCYDFGVQDPNKPATFGVFYNGLTLLPEVTELTPARKSILQRFPETFKLTFSKPVKRSSVEQHFLVRRIANNKAELSQVAVSPNAFNFKWNETDTEVLLTFKTTPSPAFENGKYAIELSKLAAEDGYQRQGNTFKVTDGNFEDRIFFEVGPNSKK